MIPDLVSVYLVLFADIALGPARLVLVTRLEIARRAAAAAD